LGEKIQDLEEDIALMKVARSASVETPTSGAKLRDRLAI
jgi:hypothetical protein